MFPRQTSDTSSLNSHIVAFWVGTCIQTLISAGVVLGVAFSWTAATQFSQATLTISPEHFRAPYFSMWFGTNFMILCYPVYILFEIAKKRILKDHINVRGIHSECCKIFGTRGLTPVTLLLYVTPFNVFWIFANYSYSRALMCVAASVATAISSANAAMVYFLAIVLLRERFLLTKASSVLFAIAGVVMMSIDLPKSSANIIPWLGILLSVVSAFSAAVYKVCFKKYFMHATLGQVSLFMTCLGFLNLTLNAIPTFILLITDVEHIDWKYIPWGYMSAGAVLSLLFNFLVNFGIALLSPLVVSIGMLVGIPINTACDVLFHHVLVTVLFVIGTIMIVISFVLIILPLDDWKYNSLVKCKRDKEEGRRLQANSHVSYSS